jgi:hypothetical protein
MLDERITPLPQASRSRAHCFSCLAVTLHTPEPALRQAADGQRSDKLISFNARLGRPRWCGLCRTPILPTTSEETVNGIVYHRGCWDQKARGETP